MHAQEHRYKFTDIQAAHTSLVQGTRLDSLRAVSRAVAAASNRLAGIFFLESASLIGHIRSGDVVPWDNDVDFGFEISRCKELEAQGEIRALIQRALDEDWKTFGERSPFFVAFASCECQIDCDTSKDARVLGRIVDSSTGFFADLFGYETVPSSELHNWQLEISKDWLRRHKDKAARFAFPRNVLLPLLRVSSGPGFDYGGVPFHFYIPAAPERFLNYEYGMVLDPPLLPWKFFLFTEASVFTLTIVSVVTVLYGSWIEIGVIAYGITREGGLVLMFLVSVLIGTSVLGKAESKMIKRILIAMAAVTLVYDLLPFLKQLALHAVEALNLFGWNVNPTRTLTICLPIDGACIDF